MENIHLDFANLMIPLIREKRDKKDELRISQAPLRAGSHPEFRLNGHDLDVKL